MYISSQVDPGITLISCAMPVWHDRKWNLDNLASPEWRLYWSPLKRNCRVVFEGRTTWLDPEYIIAIPPETPFLARCAGDLHQFVVHFKTRFPWSGVRPGIYVSPATDFVLQLVKELADFCAGNEAVSGLGWRESLLCLSLCEAGLLGIPADAMPHAHLDPRILDALRKLEAHPGKRMDIGLLAREAGMNVNSFIRLFKAELGETPLRRALRIRVGYAATLLKTSALSIDEIADACGFCGRHHLTRQFSLLRGQGPSSFRRNALLERSLQVESVASC